MLFKLSRYNNEYSFNKIDEFLFQSILDNINYNNSFIEKKLINVIYVTNDLITILSFICNYINNTEKFTIGTENTCDIVIEYKNHTLFTNLLDIIVSSLSSVYCIKFEKKRDKEKRLCEITVHSNFMF